MSEDHHDIPVYEDSGIPQPYHLLAPSPMPFLSAMAAGLLAVGAVLYMHHVKLFDVAIGAKGLVLGFAAVIAGMFFWWKDVIREAYVEKAHGPLVKLGLRYGMVLFIASEVMFFVAFFWAYFNAALFPTGGVWPPKGIHTVDPFDLPLVMTLILLLSGCTVTFAHEAMQRGDIKEAWRALGITVLLGMGFSGFQLLEYSHGSFGIKDGVYPSTFFMATGFHGFHVIVGTIFLAVCWLRTGKGHFTKESHFGFEAAAWYWHFVDVVWLFLFVAIYWWGAGADAGAVLHGHGH